jgi:hypothetical protein
LLQSLGAEVGIGLNLPVLDIDVPAKLGRGTVSEFTDRFETFGPLY